MKKLFTSTMLLATINAAGIYNSTAAEFNPDISLTLDGRYVDYNNETEYELPGFMTGEEAEREAAGFNIGHSEIVISANIDNLFFGKLTTAIAEHEGETEVELEEVFIETIGLGHGINIRAGRFFSSIGYLNNQHPHAWDFADAPLVYRALFSNQLIDDGMQLSWLAPTDTYMLFGLEKLRGERFPAGGATNNGKGASSAFFKLGGDVGSSHAWQLGLSYWAADIDGRSSEAHGHAGATTVEIPSFSGESTAKAIDLVYKWAPNGNSKERSFKMQMEYFIRDEEGDIELTGSDPLETSDYNGEQTGWYVQGVYQFKPRWRTGLRYDRLDSDNTGSDPDVLTEAGLDDENHTPERYTFMVDYSHSEYSRIRLQYAKDDAYEDSDEILQLQYIVTLGAHGAHKF